MECAYFSLGNRGYLLVIFVVAEKASENYKLFNLEGQFYKLLIRNCYKMPVCLEFFILLGAQVMNFNKIG